MLKIKELDNLKLGDKAYVILNQSPHWTIAKVIITFNYISLLLTYNYKCNYIH